MMTELESASPAKTFSIGSSGASDSGGGTLVSLADVLAELEANPSRDRRHVEMKSAIRKMGEVLRRPLFEIPADPAQLRALIASASRASVGMTKERWSRVRSLTLAALRDLGVDTMPGRDIAGHSPAWSGLADQLPKGMRIALSRFMSHCTRLAIEPPDATAETFVGYREGLAARRLSGNPDKDYRQAVRLWNRAIDVLPAWPRTHIPLEAHPHFYSLPWDDFDPCFVADVEAFLRESGVQGSLDELDDDYVRPVRPSTTALRRRQLRQLASVLVASGFEIERLTSLAVLVEPQNAKGALRFQKGRQGGEISKSLGQHAWLLCTIAQYWVKDPACAAALRDVARRLTVKQKGMTERNRARLRQFDLKPNLDAFLHLPATVFERARRENIKTPAEARRVMLAVAVEFLIVAPMRIGNLTGLEHERHLVDIRRGAKRNRHIVIPGFETKTDAPFEMMLPEQTAALIDVYRKVYRARICSVPSAYLFPNSDGTRRNTVSFSRAISIFIERETGIKMHAHLFRQLAGKLHLDAHPNDLETVRRVLGHTSTTTTARHYAEQRTGQAYEQYDRTIAKGRTAANPFGSYRLLQKPTRTPR